MTDEQVKINILSACYNVHTERIAELEAKLNEADDVFKEILRVTKHHLVARKCEDWLYKREEEQAGD